MIKGMFTSASGMLPRLKKQEITAHNIANVSTPGYKRDMLFTKELSRAEKKLSPRKSDWEKPMVNEAYTDYAPGIFDKTGNPLDLAIDGDGFFNLELADGTRVITRAGSFTVNKDGLLAFPGGALLIGAGGPIEVGNVGGSGPLEVSSGKVTISPSGDVDISGIVIGRIVPVGVSELDQLAKIGSSLFVVPEGVELIPVTKYTIRQGYLEASNVDVVREMVDMIISFRSYEANARALQAQDRSLDHLFNRVGGRG